MESVKKLSKAVDWPTKNFPKVDWSSVEDELGSPLPVDYKELLRNFPPGVFIPHWGTSIIVHAPMVVNGKIDYLRQFTTEVEELSDWRDLHPEDVRHPIHPEPGGLIPWARSDRACLFWVRNSPRPDDWTVAVSSGGIWRYDDEPVVEEFDCGAVEFLTKVTSGAIRSRVLAPDENESPRTSPGFSPLSAEEWASISVKNSTES